MPDVWASKSLVPNVLHSCGLVKGVHQISPYLQFPPELLGFANVLAQVVNLLEAVLQLLLLVPHLHPQQRLGQHVNTGTLVYMCFGSVFIFYGSGSRALMTKN